MGDHITAYLGRIAVLKEHRGKKIGTFVTSIRASSKQKGAQFAHVRAQLHARGFYEKLGYQSFGEEFDDCGKMHIHMKRCYKLI